MRTKCLYTLVWEALTFATNSVTKGSYFLANTYQESLSNQRHKMHRGQDFLKVLDTISKNMRQSVREEGAAGGLLFKISVFHLIKAHSAYFHSSKKDHPCPAQSWTGSEKRMQRPQIVFNILYFRVWIGNFCYIPSACFKLCHIHFL